MKLSEMKQILAGSNIRLSKSLGQNFLHDGNQLRRIVAAGELTVSDRVLEIGPGLGPLTELLLAKAGEVFAIEKDRRLVDLLRHRFAGRFLSEGPEAGRKPNTGPSQAVESCAHSIREAPLPAGAGGGSTRARERKFSLVHDDALEFLQQQQRDWSAWKLVANLPYSVASPMLVELAQARGSPERMVVTVQREVAQRLVANPGDKDYGLLTLLIQLRYEPHGLFKVPAGCFYPRPDVDSACVTLLRRSKPLLNREQADTFTKIVKRAFSQRRKMMLKLLREDWPKEKLERAFEASGISPRERAEELSLEQFVVLTENLFCHE
jgi:16S rRNA (adenine1518-N6/adenine1519-N6)-dimethyltransferase